MSNSSVVYDFSYTTRQSNYMQTGKVEYKPVNIEDLTIVRTQCIPLIKSTQIFSGDICRQYFKHMDRGMPS